jgi:hypothetical protein
MPISTFTLTYVIVTEPLPPIMVDSNHVVNARLYVFQPVTPIWPLYTTWFAVVIGASNFTRMRTSTRANKIEMLVWTFHWNKFVLLKCSITNERFSLRIYAWNISRVLKWRTGQRVREAMAL